MLDTTKGKVNKVWLALDELVNAWESDETAQESFNEFIASGGNWTVPALEEIHAEFAQFIIWLAGNTN